MPNLKRFSVVLAFSLLLTAAPLLTHAETTTLFSDINGAQQVPSMATPGVASASMLYDSTTRELTWAILFIGLETNATAAHFHAAAAGSVGPLKIDIGAFSRETNCFPLGSLCPFPSVTAGHLMGSTVVDEEDVASLLGEGWYIDLHTVGNPTGELRGVVQNSTAQVAWPMTAQVPEPSMPGLLLLGLGSLVVARVRPRSMSST